MNQKLNNNSTESSRVAATLLIGGMVTLAIAALIHWVAAYISREEYDRFPPTKQVCEPLFNGVEECRSVSIQPSAVFGYIANGWNDHVYFHFMAIAYIVVYPAVAIAIFAGIFAVVRLITKAIVSMIFDRDTDDKKTVEAKTGSNGEEVTLTKEE